MHDWAEVHRLFHREGMSKSRISERLGMSRNTVARLLSLDEPPRYRRKPRGSKLDPHKGSIAVMLERDPRVPARVILERLRREGYEGGITILKDYLARVRPPKTKRVYQRTSYLPGELAQCDWWQLPGSVPVGGGASRKVYGLVTTLPYSAAHAAVFSQF
ncbi:MAG: helix-turn-helix domain-containing protein [bacterium]|nr:helix-turn-helix domain-containing protein [bacterium]